MLVLVVSGMIIAGKAVIAVFDFALWAGSTEQPVGDRHLLAAVLVAVAKKCP